MLELLEQLNLSPWAMALWWDTTSDVLSWRAPADVLDKDPEAVIDAAVTDTRTIAVRLPPPGLLPAFRAWPAGYSIVRTNSSIFGSTEFDRRADADARWSSISPNGLVQGVLYGASGQDSAASETLFHTVAPKDNTGADRRPRQIFLGPYEPWVWSTVACGRELNLVDLGDDGLAGLGTTREELVLSGRLDYARTRAWAEALWHAAPDADGLYWESRQAPGQAALVLFEKRDDRPGGVARHELYADGPPDPLFYPQGLERLYQLGNKLDITIVI